MEPELIDLINDWGFGWGQVLNYLIFKKKKVIQRKRILEY